MECNVIQDLLPLYLDGCCSEESAKMVVEHTKTCAVCGQTMNNAKRTLTQVEVVKAPKLHRVGQWKASILQSVLFLLYFGTITVGVALEAATPQGLMNGYWAFNLVIPATGALLALVNWYFIRLYSTRRAFVTASVIGTFVLSAICLGWGVIHYEVTASTLGILVFSFGGIGTVFHVGNLLFSLLLSNAYARLMGKE